MKIRLTSLLVFQLVILVMPISGQWTDDISVNTLVTDSAYYNEHPSFISDGSGGYFVVWNESHGFPQYADVYAQHIDADGYMLWGSGGVPVGDEPWIQTHSVVARDNDGGIYLAWMDNRDSNNGSEEYKPAIAHLNSDGNILWTFILQEDADLNIAIPTFPINILSDGSGGVFVSWTTYTVLQSTNIMVQRLDENGTFLWGENLNVSPVSYNQHESQIVSDGVGGCYVGWTDERDGQGDFYAQHLDSNGIILWAENGLPLLTEFDNSNFGYRFISDGENGAYIAYARRIGSTSETDIYAQRINTEGQELWGENGLSVCSAIDFQTELEATLDDDHNLLIVWEDHRETENNMVDIYAQKLNSTGEVQWTTDGVQALDGEYGGVTIAAIVQDGQGGAFVSGANSNYTDDDIDQIQLSHIQSTGIINGEYQYASSSTSPNKLNNRLLPTADGRCISLWAEDRFGETHRLYLQKTTFTLVDEATEINPGKENYFWPNPCVDVLNIPIQSQLTTIEMFDSMGKKVLEVPAAPVVNMSSLPNGLYLVKTGLHQSTILKN